MYVCTIIKIVNVLDIFFRYKLLETLPTEPPKLIKPSLKLVDFTKLEKTITKCRTLGIFDESTELEWTTFIANEFKTQKDWSKIPSIKYVNTNKKESGS